MGNTTGAFREEWERTAVSFSFLDTAIVFKWTRVELQSEDNKYVGP